MLVWQRFDADGPERAWRRATGRINEWRSWREAMRRTLEEIDSLPETGQ